MPRARRAAVFLGVDAGASHTEAVVVGGAQEVLARARGAGAAVGPRAIAAAARRIAALAQKALARANRTAPADALVVGAAGAGRADERAGLKTALEAGELARRIDVVTDGEIALESVFPDGPGMVLVAGTGSVAYARGPSGVVRRIGGLGWQLGDEGSGYALGRAALGAAGRAMDGRGAPTLLGELLPRRVGVEDLSGLVVWAQAATRADIAALAEVACAAALAGDPVARELVEGTAHELAEHVAALLRHLAPEEPGGIALGGGLLSGNSPVRTRLVAVLARVAPRLRIPNIPVDPALGAARLAGRLPRRGSEEG